MELDYGELIEVYIEEFGPIADVEKFPEHIECTTTYGEFEYYAPDTMARVQIFKVIPISSFKDVMSLYNKKVWTNLTDEGLLGEFEEVFAKQEIEDLFENERDFGYTLTELEVFFKPKGKPKNITLSKIYDLVK